jgi:hypothetical protein
MTPKEFNSLIDETTSKTAELLKLKGAEYSIETDRLSNFKRAAERLGMTPMQVALSYMDKHYTSVCTYVNKDAKGYTQILSEPIEGRFHDLINYCYLMLGLLQEIHTTESEKTRKSLVGKDHGQSAKDFEKGLDESNAYLQSLVDQPLPKIIYTEQPFKPAPLSLDYVSGCGCNACTVARGS